MDKEKMLTLVKRVAAILLMACFVLPLSRCTSKADPEGRVVGADTYLYGYEMAQDALRDLNVDPLKSVGTLTALFIVFFLPAAGLRLKDRAQAPVYLLSSFTAAYLLFSWAFLFKSSVQIGAVIAVTCWSLIFAASCKTIFELLACKRQRRDAHVK